METYTMKDWFQFEIITEQKAKELFDRKSKDIFLINKVDDSDSLVSTEEDFKTYDSAWGDVFAIEIGRESL